MLKRILYNKYSNNENPQKLVHEALCSNRYTVLLVTHEKVRNCLKESHDRKINFWLILKIYLYF